MRGVLIAALLIALSGCSFRDRNSFQYVDPNELASCHIKQNYDINNPPTIQEILEQYALAVISCGASNDQIEAFKSAAQRLNKT